MTAMRDAFTVTLHQHRQDEDTFLRPNIRPKADRSAVIIEVAAGMAVAVATACSDCH